MPRTDEPRSFGTLGTWLLAGLLVTAMAPAWSYADEIAGDGICAGCTVIEGDIILPPGSPLAGTLNFNLWPDGIVPYEFNANVTSVNQNAMRDAMDEWESVAGLHFIPRTNESNYLHIQNSTGNSSFVGMIGGGQTVNIFNWNFKYIMAHELAHALGVWHEQSRTDRGGFVQINTQNIQSGFAHNFNIQSSSEAFGPYDFESIMHYGRCAFSIGGGGQSCSTATQTITVLPPNQSWQTQIGQRTHLSDGDKASMAWLYPPVSAPISDPVVRNRYLTFAPNNDVSAVSIAVELFSSEHFPMTTGPIGWVGAPDANGLSRVVDAPVARVWTESQIDLSDCEIVPASIYILRAEAEGQQGTVTAAISVATADRPIFKEWGDCVGSFGGGAWTPPNLVVNFEDITAAIQAFQALPTAPPISWVDVHPETTNNVVNFGDVLVLIRAFQGSPYEFGDPAGCP